MELEPTGERMIEDCYHDSAENFLIYLFHIATYDFATQFVKGRDVLDYGCGSGYGTCRVASECASIIGVDIAGDAVEYAQSRFHGDNLEFQRVDSVEREPLPFAEGSFDVVLSFQVIEHVRPVASYLADIARVLRPGGVFIVATPDRSTRLFRGQKPWNMWHVREYGARGLKATLDPHFSTVDILRMGGDRDVLDIEIRRTRKAKWVALPVTLPFVPESFRRWSLRQMKRLGPSSGSSEDSSKVFAFDESSLAISPDASPSVNLIAVAHKH